MSVQPYYTDESVTLHHGDCIDVLRAMPDASVDAVVTDPPYGLEFMGKEWDGADGFRRSLNPADAGRESVFGRTSRTSPEYRTASKATAGMSGTGYTDGGERLERPSFFGGLNPKCMACGKWQRGGNPCDCDAPDFTDERLPRLHTFQAWCEAWARECLRVLKPGGHLLAFGGTRTSHRLACGIEDAGFEKRDSIAWLYGSGFPKSRNLDGEWQGWGTALKPAHEPIIVARKPLVGTVAGNVARFGTGALNIDDCRTPTNGEQLHTSTVPNDMRGGHYGSGHRPMNRDGEASAERRYTEKGGTNFAAKPGIRGGSPDGRWPTNVVLDGNAAAQVDIYSLDSPSRFFPTFRYEAKAPTAERPRDGDTAHPTVKPLDLMRWLVRLVTPPGGVVLEPFAGSGTTAEACVIEGFRCIAIEREAAYLPLIMARLSKPIQPDLFGGAA